MEGGGVREERESERGRGRKKKERRARPWGCQMAWVSARRLAREGQKLLSKHDYY